MVTVGYSDVLNISTKKDIKHLNSIYGSTSVCVNKLYIKYGLIIPLMKQHANLICQIIENHSEIETYLIMGDSVMQMPANELKDFLKVEFQFWQHNKNNSKVKRIKNWFNNLYRWELLVYMVSMIFVTFMAFAIAIHRGLLFLFKEACCGLLFFFVCKWIWKWIKNDPKLNK